MAKVIVGHHPELTAEDAMKIFQSHFADKYEIYKIKMPGFDFVVKKSAWRAVGVRLKKKRNQTTFYLQGQPGSTLVRIFWVLLALLPLMWLVAVFSPGAVGGAGGFIGLILMLWLFSFISQRPSHKLVKEIKAFVEQEFK